MDSVVECTVFVVHVRQTPCGFAHAKAWKSYPSRGSAGDGHCLALMSGRSLSLSSTLNSSGRTGRPAADAKGAGVSTQRWRSVAAWPSNAPVRRSTGASRSNTSKTFALEGDGGELALVLGRGGARG